MIKNMNEEAAGAIRLAAISITAPPVKTAYLSGEAFDPAGMVVHAVYSNGSSQNVGGYTVEPSVLTADVTAVTVRYSEGGRTAMAELTVTVTKRALAVPQVTGSLTYNGAEQQAPISGYNGTYMDDSGDLSGTGAGDYTAVYALKDKDNCEWADGTTEDKTVPWSIGKAEPEIILSAESVTLNADSITASVQVTADSGGDVSAESDDPNVVTTSAGDGTVTVRGVSPGGGSTTVRIGVGETANYLAGSAELPVTLEPYELSYKTEIITSTKDWMCPANAVVDDDGKADVDVLIFGAGGGGGLGSYGGGGGGHMKHETVGCEPKTYYPVTIGAGGAGGKNSSGNGKNGGASSFGTLLSASGGEGGNGSKGGNGGTGGGGGKGKDGGNGTYGGGGGASGNSSRDGKGGDGGTYGGGGGAGGYGIQGAGGKGGIYGGDGGNSRKAGNAGTDTRGMDLDFTGTGAGGSTSGGGGGGGGGYGGTGGNAYNGRDGGAGGGGYGASGGDSYSDDGGGGGGGYGGNGGYSDYSGGGGGGGGYGASGKGGNSNGNGNNPGGAGGYAAGGGAGHGGGGGGSGICILRYWVRKPKTA